MRSLGVVLGLFFLLIGGCGGDGGGDGEGDDGDGGLGTPGSPAGYLTPELVSSTLTFNTIEASGWHTCGVAGDGATYCWGTNDYGQLGSTENMELCTDLFRQNYSCTGTPHQVDTDLRFVVLAGSLGQGVTCGLTAEGEAYCWGFGLGGQLGDGQQTNSATPIAVSGGLQFESIRVSSDGSGACGTTATGDLYCWGALGLGIDYWLYECGSFHTVSGGCCTRLHLLRSRTDACLWSERDRSGLLLGQQLVWPARSRFCRRRWGPYADGNTNSSCGRTCVPLHRNR